MFTSSQTLIGFSRERLSAPEQALEVIPITIASHRKILLFTGTYGEDYIPAMRNLR